MKVKDNFFSPSHKRLLNIATWAKYLAWIVLIIHIFSVIGTFFQEQNYYTLYGTQGGQFLDFSHMLRKNLSYSFSLLIELTNVFSTGVVYFLLLKGISLGLNMIVETDINYRERREQKGKS